MNDKTLTFLSVLAFAAIIGVMSWRDMHPKISDTPASSAAYLAGYLAGAGITPAMVPDDNTPLTVVAGTFKYNAKGKAEWVPQGMPPATFAQRDLNLQFRFDSLPKNSAETMEKVKGVLDAWEKEGNAVNLLFLDYHPANPDFKAYENLLKDFHASFKSHPLIAVADPSWLDEPRKGRFSSLKEYTSMIAIDLPQQKIAPELLSKLDNFAFKFILRLPSGVTVPDAGAIAPLKKMSFFSGYIATLDPQKPWPKKESGIGVLPKF